MEMTEHLQRSLPESSIFNGLKPNSFYSPDKTAEMRECQGNLLFPQVSKCYPLYQIKPQLRNAAGQLAVWPRNACVELGFCIRLHF